MEVLADAASHRYSMAVAGQGDPSSDEDPDPGNNEPSDEFSPPDDEEEEEEEDDDSVPPEPSPSALSLSSLKYGS